MPRIRREMPSDAELPALEIPLEKLCFLIIKAREFDAKVPADDDASNPSDDKEVAVLEEAPDDAVLDELTAAIDGLNDDERAEVLALVWLGRGDATADGWPELLAEARTVHDWRETPYMVGIPQLGDLLEEGMSMLGRSCDDVALGHL